MTCPHRHDTASCQDVRCQLGNTCNDPMQKDKRMLLANQPAGSGKKPSRGKEPVISVEDSLRTRLRWSQERVEQLEEENRQLRGRLPGPSLDDLLAASKPTHQG